MTSRKSSGQFWRLFIHLKLFAVLVVAAEEMSLNPNPDNDSHLGEGILTEKRYLAAMAKNGRLPKFSTSQKRDESSETSLDDKDVDIDVPTDAWVDEKRHVGAFLKSHGKPNFGNRVQGRRSAFLDEGRYSGNVEPNDEKAGKRNVASLARLGGLNAVRFGRFQPQYFGGKKRVNIYNEEMNDGAQAKEDNEVIIEPDECETDEEDQTERSSNSEDNNVYPNWIQSQQKRYVAALARSGRLPVWHPQRMWWGGKRDIPNAYWLRYRSGARSNGDKRKNNQINSRFVKLKNKRCKKSVLGAGYANNLSEEKRNLSMLARKGMLPVRPQTAV